MTTTAKHVSISTPWGMSDDQSTVIEGIEYYSTPGHGGLKLSPERNARIPEVARKANGWYEEDSDWSIPACVFHDEWRASYAGYSDQYKDEMMAEAKKECRRNHPALASHLWGEAT